MPCVSADSVEQKRFRWLSSGPPRAAMRQPAHLKDQMGMTMLTPYSPPRTQGSTHASGYRCLPPEEAGRSFIRRYMKTDWNRLSLTRELPSPSPPERATTRDGGRGLGTELMVLILPTLRGRLPNVNLADVPVAVRLAASRLIGGAILRRHSEGHRSSRILACAYA